LSKYATGTDALKDAFLKDKGQDIYYLTKMPDGSTYKYKTNVPSYYVPSISPEELRKNNLYLPKGKQLTFDIAGETVNGVRFASPDIFKNYINDLPTQIAFEKAFREQNPDFEKLTPDKQDELRRAFLADYLKKLRSPYTSLVTRYLPKSYGSGRSSSSLPVSDWDISQYNRDEEGGIDITKAMQGYGVTKVLDKKYPAKRVIYYPDTKEFKITEYAGIDNSGNITGETTRRIPYNVLRQEIVPLNKAASIKALDRLVNQGSYNQNNNQNLRQNSGNVQPKKPNQPKQKILDPLEMMKQGQ